MDVVNQFNVWQKIDKIFSSFIFHLCNLITAVTGCVENSGDSRRLQQ